jgi:ferrous iron transport protein B
LGILAGIGEVSESDPTLIFRINQLFTPLSAYAFMIFTLLAAPCAAAIGATRREMQSARWTWIAILFQTGLAYLAALLVFQIGSLFV